MVQVENQEIAYFLPNEDVTWEGFEVVGFVPTEDPIFAAAECLRRTLTKMVSPRRRYYGILSWPHPCALQNLDRRVLAGSIEDQDFASALLVQPRTVNCRVCGTQFRGLVVDTGQAIFAETLPSRLRSRRLFKNCPACNEELGLYFTARFTASGDLEYP